MFERRFATMILDDVELKELLTKFTEVIGGWFVYEDISETIRALEEHITFILYWRTTLKRERE